MATNTISSLSHAIGSEESFVLVKDVTGSLHAIAVEHPQEFVALFTSGVMHRHTWLRTAQGAVRVGALASIEDGLSE